jgi:hypothetical protein
MSQESDSSSAVEAWETVQAQAVKEGDVVRTSGGDVMIVSRIELSFLGRPNLLAFIEDTPERWFKRPVAVDAEVEVRSLASS